MKYRILLIDIEVLQEGTRFPDIEKADRPVIAITFYDSYTDKYLTVIQREDLEFKKEIRDNWIIVHFPTEEDMLCFVFQFLSRLDPDIIAGWNINFDITYLKNRYKTLKDNNRTLKVISEKIESWLEERQIFDMLQAYKRVKNLPSYALGYVAEHEGLSEKTEDARDIPYLYHNELDRLIVYNYTDVKILKELEDKIGLIDFYISMKGYVGVPDINDCFYFSVLLDTVLLRIAKKRGVCLPSRRYESNEESYEGAIVFEPVPGLHRNVIVLDMAKFYPSIILTLNISPETLSDIDFSPSMDKIQIQVPEEIGLVPEMVLFLKKQREMIEEQMKKFTPGTPEYEDLSRKRQVVKDLLNAVYGFLGYEKSRIYVKKLAELVTWTARQGILWAAKRAEEMGYRAVYGDSVTGDTRVPIFTKSGKFKYIEIEKLFDHYKDKKSVKKYTTPSGKEILDVSRLKIYTIATDEFGNIKIRKIKKIIRHKVDKKIYKVRTESGKEIKVTEDHSLMVWKGNRLVPMTPKVINTDSLLYVFDADLMYDMWLRDRFEVSNPRRERITEIREIKTNKEEFVYDLEVEDCHTFLANDIFVHNTDSLLIKLDEGMSLDEVVETGRELEEKITKSFDEFAKEKLGVKKHYFALEFEKVFDPVGFFPKTKKRYFARVVWEKGEKCDYVLVRGLEVRRTDSPEITRDMQERVIEMILYGKDKKEIISYVKNIVDKIKSGQVPIKDLGIPKGIQKPILSYGGSTGVIPFHIRAAMYSNKYLGTKYDKGDKIKVLYVKKIEGLPPTDVLAFDDSIVDKLPKLTVDYDRIIDVCVRSKIEKFLELIGSSWNEIIGCKSLFSLRKNQ